MDFEKEKDSDDDYTCQGKCFLLCLMTHLKNVETIYFPVNENT